MLTGLHERSLRTKNAAPFLWSLIEIGCSLLTVTSESISNIIYYVKDKYNEYVCFPRCGKFYKIEIRHETMYQEVLPPLTFLVSK